MDTSPTDEPFEAAAICEGDPFTPLSLTRVVTESSVWLLDPTGIDGAGRYLRMPRDEAPRWRTHSRGIVSKTANGSSTSTHAGPTAACGRASSV